MSKTFRQPQALSSTSQLRSEFYEGVRLVRDVPTTPDGDTEIVAPRARLAQFRDEGWRVKRAGWRAYY